MDEISKRNFETIQAVLADHDTRLRHQQIELDNVRNALVNALNRVTAVERMLQLPSGHGPTAH